MGLTLGLTCGIILFLVVRHEKSFDTFHKNYKNIYRVTQTSLVEGETVHQIGVPKPMPNAIREKISGVGKVTHFFHSRYGMVRINRDNGEQVQFFENPGVVYAEPELFEVFDWDWITGDPDEALLTPRSVVIDSEKSEKYFGSLDAVGKTIHFEGVGDLLIKGVVRRRPNNTDFPFEIFISMSTLANSPEFTNWRSNRSDDRAYLLLNDGVSPKLVADQITEVIEENLGDRNDERRAILQPLAEVHFDEELGNLNYRTASRSYLLTLRIVSVFIVLIACFNFINMSTAVAIRMAKEVSIRKILGSSRSALINRFIKRTFWVVLLSMLVSLGLVEILMPTVVKDFTGITIDYSFLGNADILIYLLTLLIAVTFIAGYYPARLISGFRPVYALKNNFSAGKKGMLLRRILVIVQFSFALIFLFGTLVVVKQSNYARQKTLGTLDDGIVNLRLPDGKPPTLNSWIGELSRIPGIVSYSFAKNTPFSGSASTTDASFELDGKQVRFTAQMKEADAAYFETYNLEIKTGEKFQELETVDGFVVNEQFVKKMTLDSPEDALGTVVHYKGINAPIKGVVENFHTTTAKRVIPAIIMFYSEGGLTSLGVKLMPGNTDQVLGALENVWSRLHPERTFEYDFYDEYIARYYNQEKKISQMLLVFAAVAVAITCLGLYGIVAFIANIRGKEIGIRRVLGASLFNVAGIFSYEFLKLVLIAFVIASPVAYYLMDDWLTNYIYRTEIGPWIFSITLAIMLLIAWMTTLTKSVKSANANLVKLLRDE